MLEISPLDWFNIAAIVGITLIAAEVVILGGRSRDADERLKQNPINIGAKILYRTVRYFLAQSRDADAERVRAPSGDANLK